MRFMFPMKPIRISVDSTLFESCSKDPNFILQVKKNGWRLEIIKDGDQVEFYTRHNKRMEPIVGEADWEMLRQLVRDNVALDKCILDGEFLHRRGEKKNTIYLWDIFYNGELCRKSYRERKDYLETVVTDSPFLYVAQDYVDNFKEVWDDLNNPEENEGIVLKDLREGLRVNYRQPSKSTSPKQFKILLSDKRNN